MLKYLIHKAKEFEDYEGTPVPTAGGSPLACPFAYWPAHLRRITPEEERGPAAHRRDQHLPGRVPHHGGRIDRPHCRAG